MNTTKLRTGLAKTFRGIAYVSVILQWLWLAVLVVPPIIESGALTEFTKPTDSAYAPVLKAEPIELNSISMTLIALITLAILAITIILLLRLPKTVVHSGDLVVGKATEIAVPILTHNAHVPPKKRRQLTLRITLLIQLLLGVLPAAVTIMLPSIDSLSREVIVTIAATLLTLSLVNFLLARLAAPAQSTSRIRSHASRG